MITFMEKERTWILSDPGELSLGIGGKLEPSITPSMFIESPSSLDLMLGTQKRPSWDSGFTDSSKLLQNKSVEQKFLKPKTPPHNRRKRKASWSGGFEDQERLVKSEPIQEGLLNRPTMGYSSLFGKHLNLQFHCIGETKVLLENVPTAAPIIKKFEPELREFLQPKGSKSSLDNFGMENHPQQCGRKIEEEVIIPKFVTSLVNSRPKKRTMKLEEKSNQSEMSKPCQGSKVTPNIAELLVPNDNRVKEEGNILQASDIKFLGASSFVNHAAHGTGTLAPSNSREPTSPNYRGTVLANHQAEDDVHVGSSTVKWKESKDSLLAGSLEKPKRRIKIVHPHCLEEGRSANIRMTICTTSSPEKELGFQTATVVDERNSKKCLSKNDNHGLDSSAVETRTILASKPKKYPAAESAPASVCATSSEQENCSKKKSPENDQNICDKRLVRFRGPSLSGEDLRHSTCNEGSTKENISDMGDDSTIDLGKGGNVRARTKRLLQLFHTIHKQFKGGHKEVDVRNIIVECYPQYLVNGSESLYGEVPGVEAGDRFNYRVEMDLVGLHHHLRRGIDVIVASKSNWCINGKPVSIAACIVVAGGYVDNRDEGDIIIYTGEGGNNHFFYKGPSKDQMLTFGNKALRHSMMLGLYVRVVRKFDMKLPTKPYYRYDGLYEVIEMKKERSKGHKKTWAHNKDGEKHKLIHKCKAVPFKPLVYKFVLVRKSTREKYKGMNLWACKPPISSSALE